MRATIRLATVLSCLTMLCSCIPMEGLPGQPHVIATADYTVDAVKDQSQSDVTANFSIYCHAADQVVTVLPRTVALLDWQADSGRIVPQGDSYVFVAREPGTYHLTVKFLATRQSPTPGTNRLDLPGVPANRIAVQVRLPGDSGRLDTLPQGIITADTVERDVRTVNVLAPLTPTFALQWQKAAVAEAAETAFSVRNDARVDVRAGLATRREILVCTVQRGSFDHLTLAVPDGVAVRRVTGKDILSWSASDDGRSVSVRLARKVDRQTSLVVYAEEVLPAMPAQFAFKPVSVAEAGVQEGSVQFLSVDEMVVEEGAVVGVSRRTAAGGGRATLSYDYSRLPIDIRLQVSERQPRVTVAVESLAVIEAGVVTLHSELSYQVQSRPVRGVTIGLPQGATVLDVAGAFVRDWEVGDDGMLRVRFSESRLGPVKLSVRTHQNIQKINGFVIPRLQPADVASEAGVIGVSAGEGMQLRHHRATLTEQVDAGELPEWIRQGGAKLAYRYRQSGGTLAVETEKIVARVTADMTDVVNLEQDALMRTTSVNLTVEDEQIFEVALEIPASLTPLRVTGQRIASWRLTPTTDGGKTLLTVTLTDGLTGPTSFVLEATRTVDYGSPLAIESIDLSAAQRLTGRVVIVPLADLKLSVASVQGLRESSAATLRRAEPRTQNVRAVRSVPASARSLHYEFTAPWSASLRVDPLVPLVAVAADTLLKIGQGEISAASRLDCTIQEAGVSVLRVQLPSWAVNSWIDAEDISGRRLDPETNTWTMTLATRRKGRYTLRVTYDRLIDRDASDVVHEEPRVLEAASHKGVLRIAKQSDQVDVTVAPSGHARPVENVAETVSGGLPLVRAVEYSGLVPTDWSLSLKMAQLGEADVLKLQASDCLLQTMVNRDGTAVTFMTLTVQNTRQQFAPIELPDQRQLWGAYVDGRPVKPVEGDRANTYRIPLLQRANRDGDFELTVVYTEQLPPLEGRDVEMSFKTPPVEVATGSMGWEVFMPPGYTLRSDLVGDESNMRMVIRPPDVDVPVTDLMLGPDSDRWRQVRPFVMPVVRVALAVLGGLVALAALAVVVWLLARYGPRLLQRTAAPGARVVRFVRQRPALKWAAVMMLVAIPLLAILGLLMAPALEMATGNGWDKRSVDASVTYSPGVWSESRVQNDMTVVGQALEDYRATNAMYPKQLEDLAKDKLVDRSVVERLKKQEGFNYFGSSLNSSTWRQEQAQSQPGNEGVLMTSKNADGYTVVRPGNQQLLVDEADRRKLAAELYYQGDVNNPIVGKDLDATAADLKKISESYEKGKMLGGKSRARQDANLLQLEATRRMNLARELYGQQGQSEQGDEDARLGMRRQRAPQQSTPTADVPADMADEVVPSQNKYDAFKSQAVDVLREAQKAAGVKETKVLTDDEKREGQREGGAASESGRDVAGVPSSTTGAGDVRPVTEPGPAPAGEVTGPTTPQNGEGPHGGETRVSHSASEEPDAGWRSWETGGAELVSLAPVQQGRTRGSLPIGLQLPQSDQLPYMFSRIGRGFSGGDMGHFQVQAVRSGSGYAVYTVAGLAVVGLLVTVLRHAGRRLHRHRHAA